MSPRMTVFTATHNRAHSLPRVYESLKKQTFRDFEWIIVDNESVDDTRQLVENWQAENHLVIRYFWQKDGHRKTALNRAVREAHGEFFVALDSDDEALPEALEVLDQQWNEIPDHQKHEFVGVTAHCMRPDGQLVGSPFPADVVDCDSVTMFYRHSLVGEKWGHGRTEIVRQYPYPEHISGYVPEGITHSAIAKKYKTRFVNKVLRVYHDSVDSQSKELKINFDEHAEGFCLWYRNQLDDHWPLFRFKPVHGFFVTIEYIAWSKFMRRRAPPYRLRGLVPKAIAAFVWPAGLLLYRRRAQRQRQSEAAQLQASPA